MSVGFELDPVAGGQETPVTPPAGLLWAAAVAFLAGAALLVGAVLLAADGRLGGDGLLDADGLLPHLAGYVLNGLVAVGMVASFPRVDAVRRRSRYYSPRPSLARVAACLAVATVLVAAGHAWVIADGLARAG